MIDGPLLLLAGPLAPALVAYVLRRWPRVSAITGAVLMAMWSAMVAVLPLDATPLVRETSLFAGNRYVLLGRVFLLEPGVHLLLLGMAVGIVVLCLLAAIWPQGPAFVPASALLLSPLAAMLMLQALGPAIVTLVPIAALLLWISEAGRTTPQGDRPALTFLALFVIAACALLVVGWTVDTSQAPLAGVAWRLCTLGIAVIMAGFPFYWWVPRLSSDSPALLTPLLFGIVQLALVGFIARLLNANRWLPDNTPLTDVLRVAALASLLAIAFLALIEALRNSGPARWTRLVGFLIVTDMQISILLLASGSGELWEALITQYAVRFFALALIAIAIARAGRERPDVWGSALLVAGGLTLSGFPLTPGFALRRELIGLLAPDTAAQFVVVAIVIVLLFVFGVELWRAEREDMPLRESLSADRLRAALTGGAVLLTIGLAAFPQPLTGFAAAVARLIAAT